MPRSHPPPLAPRNAARSSTTEGAARSVQPTTAAISSLSSASARNSGVSSGTQTVCTSTVALTPARSASGARSATPKSRRIGAIRSPVIQG